MWKITKKRDLNEGKMCKIIHLQGDAMMETTGTFKIRTSQFYHNLKVPSKEK